MKPTLVQPDALSRPGGHYSHGAVASGLVFVAGQLPVSGDGTRLVDAPFETQARQALGNVAAVLTAAGSRIDLLVSVRVYITDIAHWPVFDAVYRDWTPSHRPARAIVPVPALHHGFLIEIEAVGMIA